MSLVNQIIDDLNSFANETFAKHHAKFFQTQAGGYGEGDKFIGLRVPQTRAVAKKYFKVAQRSDIETLLSSEIHEIRLCALEILVHKMKKADNLETESEIYDIYIKNLAALNNWDLVDLSAPNISGRFWYDSGDTGELWRLARSGNLWHMRVAIISNYYFIKREQFAIILELSKYMITNNIDHDLIQKAYGWMLREAGKMDKTVLIAFLDEYAGKMPRTALRYSIEKLSDEEPRHYMGRR
ncbi:MAG: DNA alkylation repair protein [Deferribacteraceae bacterium]|jgi:3-methyladenine DNA glycosylase AlkD|nr:DNA alkylation repair protein [Deferribacteraceae bacterium]